MHFVLDGSGRWCAGQAAIASASNAADGRDRTAADQRPRFSVVARFEKWPRVPLHIEFLRSSPRPMQICQMFFSEAPDSMGNRILASTGFVQVLRSRRWSAKRAPHHVVCANPQAMLAVSPVIRHRVDPWRVEIGPCYIPSVAVARRPQQNAPLFVPTSKSTSPSSREVFHSRSTSIRGPRASSERPPALQHRALHGLERHANFACALVSSRRSLLRHL